MKHVQFVFSRLHPEGEPDGFDLGDMTVVVGEHTHTSRGETTRLAMMIYIALSSLIDGVAELLSGDRNVFELVAADSSYSFTLTRSRFGIRVSVGKRVLGDVSQQELSSALSAATKVFMSEANALPVGDAAGEDLANSVERLKRAKVRVESTT